MTITYINALGACGYSEQYINNNVLHYILSSFEGINSNTICCLIWKLVSNADIEKSFLRISLSRIVLMQAFLFLLLDRQGTQFRCGNSHQSKC